MGLHKVENVKAVAPFHMNVADYEVRSVIHVFVLQCLNDGESAVPCFGLVTRV